MTISIRKEGTRGLICTFRFFCNFCEEKKMFIHFATTHPEVKWIRKIEKWKQFNDWWGNTNRGRLVNTNFSDFPRRIQNSCYDSNSQIAIAAKAWQRIDLISSSFLWLNYDKKIQHHIMMIMNHSIYVYVCIFIYVFVSEFTSLADCIDWWRINAFCYYVKIHFGDVLLLFFLWVKVRNKIEGRRVNFVG